MNIELAGKITNIVEEYEATCGHHEYYQHGMCQDCSEKLLRDNGCDKHE